MHNVIYPIIALVLGSFSLITIFYIFTKDKQFKEG